MKKILCAVFMSLIVAHGAIAQSCVVPVKELQAGVFEADLGNVRIKLEQYNKIVKMKLISSLNEDWTSISTADGIGQISGFIGNGSEARLVSQIVVRQGDDGFDWAILKLDSQGVGTAYFSINNSTKCLSMNAERWNSAVKKVLGDITNTSAVNLPNDSLA